METEETEGQVTQDDPFAQEEDDPFAETRIEELANELPPEPASELPPDEPGEPPIVNREGQRVDPTQASSPEPLPSGAPVSPPAEEAHTPPPASGGPTEDESSKSEDSADPPTPAVSPSSAEPTTGAGTAGPVSGEPANAEGSEPSPTTQPAGEVIRRTRKRKQADTNRLYRPLYQTGKGRWAELDLTGGGTDGAIKDHVITHDDGLWIEAANVDQARRLAYAAAGRPRDGIRLVVVAAKTWAPKTVKPRVVPSREALEIS